jgi:HTH-type transcriptional regulator/antitoxin MqsA
VKNYLVGKIMMKNTQSQCPVCNIGQLQLLQATESIQYKSHSLFVDLEYALCPHCNEEMVLTEQIKLNDCRIRDAWRKFDGLLTSDEIIGLRNKLKITQQQAAQMFGGGVNAFSKYERSEIIQSEAMDKLMRLALEESSVDVATWLKNKANVKTTNNSNRRKSFDLATSAC